MSDRYKGALLSPTPPTVTSTTANGVYTLSQQTQYQGSGTWPSYGKLLTNSLRFRSSASAYLQRTPSVSGSGTTFTWSGWVKRGILTGTNHQVLFSAGTGDAALTTLIFDYQTNQINFLSYNGSTNWQLITSAVYRDPSAWYHVVAVVDTTQATSTNRIKLYVNGTQITSFSTSLAPTVYPSQNYASPFVNQSGIAQFIGRWGTWNGSHIYDGYMAEINFIDGQALTPSSFGMTNAAGTWSPIGYAGTYGTNGFYLPFTPNATSSYAGLLSGSNTLTAATNAAFAIGTGNFTMEAWFLPTNSSQNGTFFNVASGGIQMGYQSASAWGLAQANVAWQLTTSTLPNTNSWNHMAICRSGTGTNQTALFLNGIRVAQGTISTNYSQNALVMGSLLGYVSNARLVKGTAVYDPSVSTYTVPTSPLTNIAGTSMLTFQNSSAIDNSSNAFSLSTTGSITYSVAYPFNTGIANDYSGNGNNWTPNNISLVPDSTYDSMTDVPTLTSATAANYCVWNPNWKDSSLTVSNGNLKVESSTNNNGLTLGTIAVSSGKWYWETTIGGANSMWAVGIANPTIASPNYSSLTSGSSYAWNNSSQKYNGQSATSYGATYTTGDVLGVALDLDGGTITFYKNNTSQGTAFTGISGTFTPMVLINSSSDVSTNFGQQPFTYTPPTGYIALNTYNLPSSTIVKGNTVMDATTYTGTGSSYSVTNTASFKPDFVWVKERSQVQDHALFDSVRGATKQLSSNTTGAEATYANSLSAFNNNGFTVVSDAVVNSSGQTYVGWQWQAGQGVTSSNTSGSVTSTVSVNTTAGFSVATFTTPSSGTSSFGHGLGVTPSFVIVKSRASGNWICQHTSTGTQYTLLNSTTAATTDSTVWNSAFTSTVINLGTGFAGTINYVAYCWAAISGFSAFGSYTGNGSSDGPFVYLGFRPKFVLIKLTTGADSWLIIDSVRQTYNVMGPYLIPNTSDAESTYSFIDFTSNGFKFRNTGGSFNNSGGTYIYMAFAENPFKYANAR